MNCRVCNTNSIYFFQGNNRTFFQCPECCLIFTVDIPDKAFQEKHYKLQWETTNSEFWKNQVDALLKLIGNYNTPGRILDFGSGSGEMTKEFQRRGYDVTPIDPIINGYLKDQNYRYKFNTVIAVEVIEHLPNLWEEMNEINKVVTENAIIVCTTLLTNSFIDNINAQTEFANWWYKNDQTHVNFFCNKTIVKFAEMWNYSLDIYGNNAFVLHL